MGLLPSGCKATLERVLQMRTKRCLLLIDSFEELSADVEALLRQVLTRELYEHVTVLVTSRPGSRLTEIEQGVIPRVTGRLQGFTEGKVLEYISQYPHRKDSASTEITSGAFGMTFLQTPINLALLCFLHSSTSWGGKSEATQTGLLNQILQHIVQAYVRKMKGQELGYTTMSLLSMQNLSPDVRARLMLIGKMCLEALKNIR